MTKIEWTQQTWNPIAGCSIVSPGCTNCYAMKMARRLDAMGVPHYQGLTKVVNGNPVWTGQVHAAPDDIVTSPLRRRKPTMYFVNSMSDLFHEDVPDEQIDKIFAVMALTGRHTHQVLTKRSARMQAYITMRARSIEPLEKASRSLGYTLKFEGRGLVPWPLPNVWLGVSAERQKEADERIPDLISTPAAVRFVSAEPLLAPLTLTDEMLAGIDWCIVGGESGPGARPMHPAWARSLRDQCQTAGVYYFFKQWGAWHADALLYTDMERRSPPPNMRIGKKAAGRLLDGREWNEMPAVAA